MSNGNETASHDEQVSSKKRRDMVLGIVLLVAAQMFCASTATCIHALPIETPSLLRGLWRQTLTFLIFTPFALVLYVLGKMTSESSGGDTGDARATSEEKPLVDEANNTLSLEQANGNGESQNEHTATAAFEQAIYIVMAMAGAALLNDLLVISLKYASSAAVMCLINTTPIWLIIYALVICKPPGAATLVGAALSIVGAVICATGGNDDNGGGEETTYKNEELGSIIAVIGACGSAVYMMACRKLSPLGIHPVTLIWLVNLGQATVSLLLCFATVDGVTLLSTDITTGVFGFLNPQANPAALCQSVFPDCLGSFGIMLSLSIFEPLIVSMVMLTEPLNASVIASLVVHEAPPSRKTIVGVSVVLVGCAIVLWESAQNTKQASELEKNLSQEMEIAPGDEQLRKRASMVQQRRRGSQMVLLSPIGTFSPDVTAKAAWRDYTCGTTPARRTFSLTPYVYREMGMSEREAMESSISLGDFDKSSSLRRSSVQSITSGLVERLKRSSWIQNYGSFEENESAD